MSAQDGPAEGRGISRDEVAHLARLARLAVTDAELDLFAGQLDVILQNVFRPDELRPGLTQEQALAGAPAAEDGRFRVPQILGEEA